MASINQGSFRLFRLAGVDVFLHWSWFLVAAYEIMAQDRRYTSPVWNVFEYLSLFSIVLLHEFGHALACRQVGGTAERIMLWPLGGVAYVDPPQRPGAMLWSIAAGPLVNVALLPVLIAAYMTARSQGWAQTMHDPYRFLGMLLGMDVVLLVFNLLPIYPLDGGKILRSLLWFALGRARSLMAVTILGFIGIAAFFALAIFRHSTWSALIAVYMLFSCWGGLKQARVLLRREKMPRREGFACPSCRAAPPIGALWGCGKCKQPFDTFLSRGVCPNCGVQYAKTMCMDCQKQYPMNEWTANAFAGAGVLNGEFPADLSRGHRSN